MTTAVRSTAIVSSLFPATVRDRLYPMEDPVKKEAPKNRMRSFMNESTHNSSTRAGTSGSSPIADLFPEATVLFSDIAGFTAWSSVRQPSQVFILLETLYGAFDKIAKRRRVFKVETIGDSYVAVVGLPDPCKDHAVVMAKFARDCREKFNDLVTQLEVTLGPGTAELQMRFGLHSGAVTAGVLRGEKGRFQLFGDTVNTASRMESNGVRNRIQVSQSTADLLIAAGKQHWVTAREDLVEAKGKGKMQTYWVEPCTLSSDHTESFTEDAPHEDALDEKLERLVDWQVEVLSGLIRQIIALRNVTKERISSTKSTSVLVKSNFEGGTVLDEVKEIIQLPVFDAELVSRQQDPNSIGLEYEVSTQLHDFVHEIAEAYHHNPFHNFEHASHMTMTLVQLFSRITAQQETGDGILFRGQMYGILDPIIQFACVFSALIHGVAHPGIPNSQLVKEKACVASVYSNRSVSEQNVCKKICIAVTNKSLPHLTYCLHSLDKQRHSIFHGVCSWTNVLMHCVKSFAILLRKWLVSGNWL